MPRPRYKVNNLMEIARVPTDKPVIQVVLTAELLAALDRWRADNQVWSRSEAIRRLIEAGLALARPERKGKTK